MERNKVYVGNNLDILKTFPDNSIDSIVTDPPYGLGKEPEANALLKDWLEHGYHEVKGKGFMGKEWDAFVPQPIFWRECYRVLKHGGHVLSFAGTRTYDWIVMGLRLSGFEIRDQLAWIYGSGFPKSLDISKAIDKKFGAEREVVGKSDNGVGGTSNTMIGGSFENGGKEYNITAPSTEQAKQWQGWGTALKPALEPIVMARKPLDGTVADNVLKHGVGGINIDGCRVEHNETIKVRFMKTNREKGLNSTSYMGANDKRGEDWESSTGRFPANIIHDGSDEVVALFPNSDGEDSAARFFYTAKASQSERNYGLEGFDSDVTTDGRTKPIDNAFNRGETQRKNIHPTVKPIDLMRYLVRLVTPKGGVCLDPFLGSGTTAVACKAEKFDYIGIELQPEYAEIAEARIKAEMVQMDIFDILED
jgi:DNA modification methylase